MGVIGSFNAWIARHEAVLSLIGTTLATLIASIQSSALILALPDLLKDLSATLLSLLWVLIAYILTTTVLVPVFGRVSDLWPVRRRSFMIGLGIFVVSCLILGLAPKQKNQCWDMVGYRVLQGIGGSLMFANGTPIITELFAKTGRLSLAIGINQIAVASGIVIGPLIGGALIKISWKWVYLFNVPVGGAIFIFCLFVLRDRPPEAPKVVQQDLKTVEVETAGAEMKEGSNQQTPTQTPTPTPKPEPVEKVFIIDTSFERFQKKYLSLHFDIVGAVLYCATMTIGLTLIAEASFNAISNGTIIALTIVTFILAVTLFVLEYYSKYPLINIRLFANLNFSIPVFAGTLGSFARSLVIFGTIFFFQGPYGKDAETAGYMIIPLGIGLLIFSFVAGAVADKIGLWGMCLVGPLISAAGLIGLTFISNTSGYVGIAASLAVVGIGAGIFNSPNTSGFMASVKPNERGAASSLAVMLQNFCQMLCITIVFKVMLGSVSASDLVQLFVYGGGGLTADVVATLVKQYHASMWIAVGLQLASFVMVFSYSSAPYRRKHSTEPVDLP